MAVLLFLNILTWKAIINFEGSELKITFLDVGQGDSILVEFPKKGNILIDGGSGGKEEEFDIGRSIIAPYLWNNGINRLDGIIATHFHEDHLGGILYILKNFDVGCVIDNGATPSSDNRLYDEYRRAIKEKRIPSLIVGEGDEIGGFSDIKLFVLNPEKRSDLLDSNDNSIVLKLVYKDSTILFCADIQDSAMERLSASYGGFLKSDILKVPHHGGFHGEEEIAKDFFRKASPKISVISVGREDRFKAPLKKTIDIVTSLNSISYKTKDNGAIRVLIGADYFKALVAEK